MDRPNRLPSVFQRRHNRKEVRCWRPVETIEPAKGVQMYGLGTSYHSIHYPEADLVLPGRGDLTAVGRPAYVSAPRYKPGRSPESGDQEYATLRRIQGGGKFRAVGRPSRIHNCGGL